MGNVLMELARIGQAISSVENVSEQVNIVVESISEVTGVAVCSLYLADEKGDMVLLATHGLFARKKRDVKLAKGQGLVGLVAQSRHPINLAEPQEHPAFVFIPGSEEEKFHSFCAVPLVKAGEVTGVLVVQGVEAREFSDDEEAFLVTLATQLTFILPEYQTIEADPLQTARFQGLKGAAGVAIGKVMLCKALALNDVNDEEHSDLGAELAAWDKLLETARADIATEQASLPESAPEAIQAVFDAYQMFLNDQAFIGQVEEAIRDGNWLPGALKKSIKNIADMFLAMEDPYLRARHEDIELLGEKLYGAWLGKGEHRGLISEPVILVGTQVSITDITDVPAQYLAGIVCYEGSRFSHTAVVANAMGIPAVMGVGRIKTIHAGNTMIVDGNRGNVVLRPTPELLLEFDRLVSQEKEVSSKLEALRELPAETQDGKLITVMANTGLLADISPGLAVGAQGIGLYRTEIPFMVHDGFPNEEEQFEIYRQVLTAYKCKPVHMRTLDIGSDKQLPYFPISGEENPALGWRGIRFGLDNVQLLMVQLRAMLRASEGLNNLRILLPMLSATEELDALHDLLDDAVGQLKEEGYDIHRPPLGAMLEVPAMISQLSFWADRLDFVSIGTNDLSQYLLAVDRNNPRVSEKFDHLHPAVIQEIFRAVQIATPLGIKVSVCGEMASDPLATVLLIGMGVRTLSMSAARILRVKSVIRGITIEKAEEIVGHALTLDTAQKVRDYVAGELQSADLLNG